MGIEIERKFLINNEKLVELLEFMPHCAYDIWQYYMSEDIRLRIATHSDGHEVANFTIKTDNKTFRTRNEFESIVSIEDAKTLARVLTKSEVGLGAIRKSRHVFDHDGTVKWEVDIFHGSNEGLIIAEVEVPDKDYDLKLTPYGWIGKEVTEDDRYYNSYLAKNPYKNWRKEK
jgi:adenylate cyclase